MISLARFGSVALVLAAFSAGWYINGMRWSARMDALKLELASQVSEARQKAIETERQVSERVASVEQETEQHETQLDTDYHGLLDNINASGLFQRSTNTDSAITPSAPVPAVPPCPCDDLYNEERRRAFRELRKEVLEYTRQCDEIANKYNGLIMFYNSVKDEYNKSE